MERQQQPITSSKMFRPAAFQPTTARRRRIRLSSRRKRAGASTFVLFLFCCQVLINVRILRTQIGLSPTAPLPVPGVRVRRRTIGSFLQNMPVGVRRITQARTSETTTRKGGNTTDSIRLRAFDEISAVSDLALPRTWEVVPIDAKIRKEQVDANTCLSGGALGAINCLPSFIILGFEKCSTTALNIFLSYHPNVLTRWMETRFFDNVKNATDLESRWVAYLRNLPSIPGGEAGLGKYWTFEKSPNYATSPNAPESIATLIPNARLLFLTRNPTQRAYSMFLMFTNHFPGVSNALQGQPVSYFIKNNATGEVRYIREAEVYRYQPGVGGQPVPNGDGLTPDDGWTFLSYPPDPQDFDAWIRHILEGSKKSKSPDFNDSSRTHRILFGGFYSDYLKKWLQYFPQERFLIIPSELFWAGNALEGIDNLQRVLGLPVFDYNSITSLDSESGRIDVHSPGTLFNTYINSYQSAPPMLKSTERLLNEFYCESNRELSRLLGGRALPGYSCAEEGISTVK